MGDTTTTQQLRSDLLTLQRDYNDLELAAREAQRDLMLRHEVLKGQYMVLSERVLRLEAAREEETRNSTKFQEVWKALVVRVEQTYAYMLKSSGVMLVITLLASGVVAYLVKRFSP